VKKLRRSGLPFGTACQVTLRHRRRFPLDAQKDEGGCPGMNVAAPKRAQALCMNWLAAPVLRHLFGNLAVWRNILRQMQSDLSEKQKSCRRRLD
jgi:hypothetical protein